MNCNKMIQELISQLLQRRQQLQRVASQIHPLTNLVIDKLCQHQTDPMTQYHFQSMALSIQQAQVDLLQIQSYLEKLEHLYHHLPVEYPLTEDDEIMNFISTIHQFLGIESPNPLKRNLDSSHENDINSKRFKSN